MENLPWLNYHHLLYFRTIVREGGVTKAAEKLRLAQSTLSAQLKKLEESLGAPLFDREGRKLELTPAGQVALDYAEDIFEAGDELRAWFAHEQGLGRRVLRIGALSPLSKNLQFEVIRPAVMAGDRAIRVVDGEFTDLLHQLKSHQIDILLTNLPATGSEAVGVQVHLLGEMPMYLVGSAPYKLAKKPFPLWLEDVPLFLPSTRSPARMAFDALLARSSIQPKIMAEVDDMALLRLFALSGAGLALVPEIGVKFDLEEQKLLRIEKIKDLKERFYAMTAREKNLPSSFHEIIEAGRKALAPLAR